jgi:fucose 4-O-acetylase-like acetyltransferase
MGRNVFIDKVKGVAIALVVWGHCIQYCAAYNYWGNRVFEVIYGFHMPLFMAISGYLYFNSINKRDTKSLIISRLKQLLMPLCVWTLLFLVKFNITLLHSPMDWLINFYSALSAIFWFIWSLLICSVITILINKFLNDSVFAYAALFVLILVFVSDGYNFYLTKFVIPYFFAGYLVHKYKLKTNNLIVAISAVAYIALIYFWRDAYYIYTSHTDLHLPDLQNSYIDLYRYLAGFTGIILFLYLMKWLPHFKVFEVLGKYTLGIYIIGMFFNPYLDRLKLHYNPFLYNFVYTPVVACLIIGICVGLSILIGKSKILNRYLLGGR